MTDFKSELRKILDNYFRSRELDERLYQQGENSHKTMVIDIESSTTKSVDDTIALFISKLPKEDTRPFPGMGDYSKPHAELRETCYQQGWNECLADIKGEIK